MIDLKGKRAIVTGGSRGIGRSTAVLLAQAGADVGIVYRARQADAEAVLAEIERTGRNAWAVAADLSSAEGVNRLFEVSDARFGGFDIFIANAGIWPPEYVPLVEM
ncbi:MAG: SDR family NAD(P)-dependent oxidoreductase, partial [Gemmatimonadota bacterium]